MTIALARAALCLECEHVFATAPRCPECESTACIPLERLFLGPSRYVRIEDVLHHAANGLTPARVRAQHIADQLESFVALGIARYPLLYKVIIRHAHDVVQSVDSTMERLRALAGLEGRPNGQ